MRTLELKPGTDEWLAERRKYNTASEAPPMMGASKKVSRNDLLHAKHTGLDREHSRWVVEVLFETGHEVEAKARPFAEAIVGEELYPAVGVSDDGYLLSSFDGITMLETVVWECKQWNKEKAAAVESGICPDEDYWQVVHQLATSGAERCLYMVTDGTEENTVHCWVEYDQKKVDRLMAGWHQFDEDLASYQPPEREKTVTGAAPEHLPALHIEVEGKVLATNLDAYKEHAQAVLANINEDLQTDEDFANAEETVKWCKGVEDKLAAAKEHALSQAGDIHDLLATVDEISEQTRQKRLSLDKLVKAEKQARKEAIVRQGKDALAAHIGQINQTLGGKITMPDVPADFAGAAKNKRTLASLQDAVDTELANAKIEASRIADGIRANLEILREDAKGYETLFADAQSLVTSKEPDDLRNLTRARIAEAKEQEERRQREREEARKCEQAEADQRQQAEAPSVPETAPGRPEPKEAPAAKSGNAPPRPRADEIYDAVANHFGVSPSVAEGWINEIQVRKVA